MWTAIYNPVNNAKVRTNPINAKTNKQVCNFEAKILGKPKISSEKSTCEGYGLSIK